MNIQKFLDSKHGKLLGRVYFLILLFIGNALIPIGAVMKFLHNGSGVLMILGIIITVAAIVILSTPYDLSNYKEEDPTEDKKIGSPHQPVCGLPSCTNRRNLYADYFSSL